MGSFNANNTFLCLSLFNGVLCGFIGIQSDLMGFDGISCMGMYGLLYFIGILTGPQSSIMAGKSPPLAMEVM